MRVALICIDKANSLQIRLDNRAAHLAHIEASGVVEMAGPFLNEAGQMTGSSGGAERRDSCRRRRLGRRTTPMPGPGCLRA